MTTTMLLEIPEHVHRDLQRHLIRPDSELEQAAFGFAERQNESGRAAFRLIDWLPVPPEGFASRSAYHFELSDEMKALAIKRAHDLGACLIEFHCHTGPWPTAFSPTDRAGFLEFVPHVLWRLKRRPYLAVVVSASAHDGLVWLEEAKSPQRLDGLLVGGQVIRSTGLTPLSMDDLYE